MKVSVVGLRGIPNIMGGIETHCQQLYPRLVKRGVAVTILARSSYVTQRNINFKGIEVISVWSLRNKFIETFLHTLVAIVYARLFVKPDLIHIHAIGPAFFSPLARLLGMKVIVTHHGADYDRQKWNSFAKNVLLTGEKFGAKFCNKMIVVGQTLTKTLQQKFAAEKDKIYFIPNGAFSNPLDQKTELSLPQDLAIEKHGYILTVGRLVPEKGFHDLIKAFSKADKPNQKLVIVGNSDHEDEYSRSLKANKTEKVIFAGRREGMELVALYKYSSLFVLPSYHEGLPIVVLEALSYGAPVLLSNIAPNLDVGLPPTNYFPLGDTSALGNKLKEQNFDMYLIDSESILAKFNWDEIAESTLLIYQEAHRAS